MRPTQHAMKAAIIVSILASLWLGWPAACHAHKPSDSYLTLRLDGERAGGRQIEGRWDIALRDLEHALGLDADLDGAITWAELRARHRAIADYALARLEVSASGDICAARVVEQLVDHHSDGAYSVLRFRLDCPRPAGGALAVDYALFFDLDPTHRGLLQLTSPAGVRSAVLSPGDARVELETVRDSAWRELATYWREGVWHIWIGFDHILFLLTLLLGATSCPRQAGTSESRRGVTLEVFRIVTAFTVAHSLTLAMAVLGWVSLPSRWVEAAIAATVVLAAIHNLRPEARRWRAGATGACRRRARVTLRGRRWVIAFALGLIHGFGFAGVLADLGLPTGALAVALLGFNLGVETGQLAIVALFLPVAFLLRDSWFYRRVIVAGGSLAVAAIAAVWLVERSLGLS